MALSAKDLRVLATLCRGGYLPEFGAVADLGAQVLSSELHADVGEFSELAQARGITGAPNTRYRDARDLWHWLGLRPTVFDIDGTRGAIPLDLNYDRAPFLMRSKFAVVTNYGTSEHVANQHNLFKVIHDLTRRWCVMIHHVPAQGYVNHGLINYNPKFFWMLARSNRYKILYHDFNVGIECPFPDNVISEIKAYEPSIADRTADFRVTDCSVTIVLQKLHAGPFIPPLDVDVMMQSDKLERRYWTVYRRSRLNKARRTAADFWSDAADFPTDVKQRLISFAIKNETTRPWFYRLRRLLGRGARK